MVRYSWILHFSHDANNAINNHIYRNGPNQ